MIRECPSKTVLDHRRRTGARLLTVTAALLWLTACERESQPAAPPRTGSEGPRTELDRLRALPYAGSVEDDSEDSPAGVIQHDRARTHPGYNLYSVTDSATAYLIDNDGRQIRSWADPNGRRWGHCRLLSNGDLLVVGADPGKIPTRIPADEDRYLMRLSWSGAVIWKRKLPAHHDVNIGPRGRILTLTAHTCRIPAIAAEIPVRDNELALLSEDGELLETHSLYEIFTSSPMSFHFQPVRPDPRGLIDLFHANTVEWIDVWQSPEPHPVWASQRLLICSRHQDAIAVVDWSSRQLVWAWGPGIISGPHDPTVLDNGHVLLFDNGLTRKWSRVIEVDPLTGQIVWEYQAPNPTEFFSPTRGACQRLANGNTLITHSTRGRAFEVTAQGEIVWDYLSPHTSDDGQRATVERVKRYEADVIEALLSRDPTAPG